MTKFRSSDDSGVIRHGEECSLPSFTEDLESVLSQGNLLEVTGTNVVRVPFGVRQPRKQRPARPNNWATLVLPLQPFGSPTPPPQAA